MDCLVGVEDRAASLKVTTPWRGDGSEYFLESGEVHGFKFLMIAWGRNVVIWNHS